MKENGIEEYVKILERFSNENVIYGFTVGMTLKKYKDLQLSAEHILQDYKSVLKENEELEEINNELEAEKNEAIRRYNFETIPIKKVKDKIEELNKKEKEELKGMKGQDRYFVKQTYQNKRIILQELIKESEK